jgi:hypothetical protein
VSTINPNNNLTGAETEHLRELEDIVQRSLGAYVEVGSSLARIREARLYRDSHPTFEAYLRERWGITASRDPRLAGAADTSSSEAVSEAWDQALQEFGDDDVVGVEVRLTVHKLARPQERASNRSANSEPAAPAAEDRLLPRLRWLLTQSAGTVAEVAYELEARASDVDDAAREQLRDDLLVLYEELATLASLLAPVDWDAEYGRLLDGEVPPLEDDIDEDDE